MDERSTAPSLPREDLELVSDLLDGRLEGRERELALDRIERDDSLYEVLVESARIRESVEPGDARGRSMLWRRVRWFAALAVALMTLAWVLGDALLAWLADP